MSQNESRHTAGAVQVHLANEQLGEDAPEAPYVRYQRCFSNP